MCVRIIMFHRPFSPLPSFLRHDSTYTQSGLLVWRKRWISSFVFSPWQSWDKSHSAHLVWRKRSYVCAPNGAASS